MMKKILSLNFINLKIIALIAAFFGVSTISAQYCVPAINCENDDLIQWVQFAGISNASGCSLNGYEDYTTDVDPAEVEIGQEYFMTVGVGSGSGSETVGMWIDFDNNEIFDSNEFRLVGTGSGGPVIVRIVIPADANIGLYRMRVSVFASNLPIDDPCFNDPSNFGEFEDYLVNVGKTASTPDFDFTNSVTVYRTGENLNISAGNILGKIEVYDLTGKLIATQQDIASRNTSVGLSATNQVLLVKVQSLEGYTTTKKVIF